MGEGWGEGELPEDRRVGGLEDRLFSDNSLPSYLHIFLPYNWLAIQQPHKVGTLALIPPYMLNTPSPVGEGWGEGLFYFLGSAYHPPPSPSPQGRGTHFCPLTPLGRERGWLSEDRKFRGQEGKLLSVLRTKVTYLRALPAVNSLTSCLPDIRRLV